MENTIKFLLETEKLKSVLRQTKPLGEDRFENSAEHSWQTAMVALILFADAPEGIDQLKVLKMLLIHDLVEIDAGDVFVYDDKARREAYEAEAAAAKRLFGILDARIGDELHALWHEFEEAKTPEAKFAKAADRVMPVLQNLAAGGQSWKEHNITRDKVIAKNLPIVGASPQLWEVLRARIEAAEFLSD